MGERRKLTTNAGVAPVVNNHHVLTAGCLVPGKLARFDREMIPERRMHAIQIQT